MAADWRAVKRCAQEGHLPAEVVWQVAENGARHLAYWCHACDMNVTRVKTGTGKSFLAKADLPPDVDLERLPVVRVVERICECWLCRQPSRCEWHHVAPKELYGDEADRFPLIPLCGECHRWTTDLTRRKIAELRGRAA